MGGRTEANRLYGLNSNPNLRVDVPADQLTADRTGPWKPWGGGGERAPGTIQGEDFYVHGHITLRHRPDDTYGIFDKPYHFNMHPWTPGNITRNLMTIIGDPGPGTPFIIHYNGNVTVNNP